ncbi:MAG: rhomboid family intramembrane serine protease, partial [archaeon]|nr:rhomboid family intramembrane serine protease [archaeon]
LLGSSLRLETTSFLMRPSASLSMPFLAPFSPTLLARHRRLLALSAFPATVVFQRGMASAQPPRCPPDLKPPTAGQRQPSRFRSRHGNPTAATTATAAATAAEEKTAAAKDDLGMEMSAIYHYHPFILLRCYEPYDRAVLPLYGSKHEGNPWVPLGLLTLINCLVCLMWMDAEDLDNPEHEKNLQYMYDHFTVGVGNLEEGRYYTLLTSAISHANMPHLFGNLFALWLFGFTPCRMMNVFYKTGAPGFLGLYLVGGALASLGHIIYLKATNQTQVMPRAELDRLLNELDDQETPPHIVNILNSLDKPALGASVCCSFLFLFSFFLLLISFHSFLFLTTGGCDGNIFCMHVFGAVGSRSPSALADVFAHHPCGRRALRRLRSVIAHHGCGWRHRQRCSSHGGGSRHPVHLDAVEASSWQQGKAPPSLRIRPSQETSNPEGQMIKKKMFIYK